MSSKGLGRGLDALFGDNDSFFASSALSETLSDADAPVKNLRISQIEPNPAQPRRDFDEEALKTLAQSIREHGLLQPLVVRPMDDELYMIIAGERRWRACRMAGLTEVPALVVTADELHADELTLIENLQRENLSSLEEAAGFEALMVKFGLTQEEISEKVGRSRSAVANSLRLLSLDDTCRELLAEGKISAGHARALLSVQDIDERAGLAMLCVSKGLSVRELEAMAKNSGKKTDRKQKREDPYIEDLNRRLSGSLGRKVKLKPGKKTGHIEIEYYNNDDLENLIALLERTEL